jgi:hypothetical protein
VRAPVGVTLPLTSLDGAHMVGFVGGPAK